MNHAAQPKNIHVEHFSNFLFVAFLDRRKITNARVIDENIDATEVI